MKTLVKYQTSEDTYAYIERTDHNDGSTTIVHTLKEAQALSDTHEIIDFIGSYLEAEKLALPSGEEL